jgi:hypothetical protein
MFNEIDGTLWDKYSRSSSVLKQANGSKCLRHLIQLLLLFLFSHGRCPQRPLVHGGKIRFNFITSIPQKKERRTYHLRDVKYSALWYIYLYHNAVFVGGFSLWHSHYCLDHAGIVVLL